MYGNRPILVDFLEVNQLEVRLGINDQSLVIFLTGLILILTNTTYYGVSKTVELTQMCFQSIIKMGVLDIDEDKALLFEKLQEIWEKKVVALQESQNRLQDEVNAL